MQNAAQRNTTLEVSAMKLLHLDSSILGSNSVSRSLSAGIVARETALHPGIEVVYRDLATDSALHLSGAHLAAWQGGAVEDAALGRDLANGGAYIDELFAADIIVIGAPMYNFTIPTQLKAWIDRIVVAGKTFRYGPQGPEGLVHGKQVIIAISRGGVYPENAPFEHAESYLKVIFGFIGVTDVTFVRAEGLQLSPEHRQKSLTGALAAIPAAKAA